MSKKSLTKKQIQNIVNVIDLPYNIPSETKKSVIKNLKENIVKQLENIEIYPSMVPELKLEVERQFRKTLVQAGEGVGVVAAQSIGERQTQMTLDTFHSAGLAVETVVTGVPRFSELLSATKEPKSVIRTIYLKDNVETIEEIRNTIGNSLIHLELVEVIKNCRLNKEKKRESWYNNYELIYGKKIRNGDKCITINIDLEKLFNYKLTLQKISKSIINELNKEYDNMEFYHIISPIWKGKIDLFIEEDKDEIDEDDFIAFLRKIKISGIDGIKSVNYRKNGEKWGIKIHGSGNFNELLQLEYVDKNSILSNNVWDIYKTLGIVAARKFLINEFINVISSDGTYINKRHVMLMVDIMSFSGIIISVSRYGIDRKEAGVFAKASFEESMDNFLKASVFTDKEKTDSVSASIMCGKIPKGGTGSCSVMMDLDALIKQKKKFV